MKLIIVVALALVAVASAGPIEQVVEILKSHFDSDPEGGYNSEFETSDGTSRSEQGKLLQVTGEDNKPATILEVRGQYSFVDPEGHKHTVVYLSDHTGYHADGEDIPKGPTPARR